MRKYRGVGRREGWDMEPFPFMLWGWKWPLPQTQRIKGFQDYWGFTSSTLEKLVFMLRGVHIIIFLHLTIVLLWISHTNNRLSAFLTGSRLWLLLALLLSKESTVLNCQSQFLPECSVWDRGQRGPGFPVLWLQSARNGSLVADAEKTRNSLLLFKIKYPAPYFIF